MLQTESKLLLLQERLLRRAQEPGPHPITWSSEPFHSLVTQASGGKGDGSVFAVGFSHETASGDMVLGLNPMLFTCLWEHTRLAMS